MVNSSFVHYKKTSNDEYSKIIIDHRIGTLINAIFYIGIGFVLTRGSDPMLAILIGSSFFAISYFRVRPMFTHHITSIVLEREMTSVDYIEWGKSKIINGRPHEFKFEVGQLFAIGANYYIKITHTPSGKVIKQFRRGVWTREEFKKMKKAHSDLL